jgi:surfeit locus 1 family protein
MTRKLPFWATVFTLLGLSVLVGLGCWQLQRLEWKNKLNSQRTMQLQELVDLDTLALDAPLPELDFRRVQLTGHYLQLGRLIMPSRTYKSEVGWHVLEFFEQDTGRIWLINRGWVAQEALNDLPMASEDEVTLTAIARAKAVPGTFTPANNPARNLWYFYDPRAMFNTINFGSDTVKQALLARAVLPYVLEAEYTNDTPPIGGVTLLQLPNNHLQYAITWFSLALVLLGVYAVFVRKLNKV